MAKKMAFAVNGKEFSAEPIKIDRKKLYGWSEVHAFDDEGNECVLVSTDASGTVIIPKNGIGLGVMSSSGAWVERKTLRTVTADGSEAQMITSSYNMVVELSQKATEEEFLDCSITALYQMQEAGKEFVDAIGGDIYRFEYCYRDSYETSPAFLMSSEIEGNKELFLYVGAQNLFEMIGLSEVAVADETENEEDEDDDEIDFSMF